MQGASFRSPKCHKELVSGPESPPKSTLEIESGPTETRMERRVIAETSDGIQAPATGSSPAANGLSTASCCICVASIPCSWSSARRIRQRGAAPSQPSRAANVSPNASLPVRQRKEAQEMLRAYRARRGAGHSAHVIQRYVAASLGSRWRQLSSLPSLISIALFMCSSRCSSGAASRCSSSVLAQGMRPCRAAAAIR